MAHADTPQTDAALSPRVLPGIVAMAVLFVAVCALVTMTFVANLLLYPLTSMYSMYAANNTADQWHGTWPAILIGAALLVHLLWVANTGVVAITAWQLGQVNPTPGPLPTVRRALAVGLSAWRGTLTITFAGLAIVVLLVGCAIGYSLSVAIIGVNTTGVMPGKNNLSLLLTPGGLVLLVLMIMLARRGHWAALLAERPRMWGWQLVMRLTRSVLPVREAWVRVAMQSAAVWIPLVALLGVMTINEVYRMAPQPWRSVLLEVIPPACVLCLLLGATPSARHAAMLFVRHRDRLTGVTLATARMADVDGADDFGADAAQAPPAVPPDRPPPVKRLLALMFGLPLAAATLSVVGIWWVWYSPPQRDDALIARLEALYLPPPANDGAAAAFREMFQRMHDGASPSRADSNPADVLGDDLAGLQPLWEQARRATDRHWPFAPEGVAPAIDEKSAVSWHEVLDPDLRGFEVFDEFHLRLRLAAALQDADVGRFVRYVDDVALLIECMSSGSRSMALESRKLAARLVADVTAWINDGQTTHHADATLAQIDASLARLLRGFQHPDAAMVRALLHRVRSPQDPSIYRYASTSPAAGSAGLYVPFGVLDLSLVNADNAREIESLAGYLALAEPGPCSELSFRMPDTPAASGTIGHARLRRRRVELATYSLLLRTTDDRSHDAAAQVWLLRVALRARVARNRAGKWPEGPGEVAQQPDDSWQPLVPLWGRYDRFSVNTSGPFSKWVATPDQPHPPQLPMLRFNERLATRLATLGTTTIEPWSNDGDTERTEPLWTAINRVLTAAGIPPGEYWFSHNADAQLPVRPLDRAMSAAQALERFAHDCGRLIRLSAAGGVFDIRLEMPTVATSPEFFYDRSFMYHRVCQVSLGAIMPPYEARYLNLLDPHE